MPFRSVGETYVLDSTMNVWRLVRSLLTPERKVLGVPTSDLGESRVAQGCKASAAYDCATRFTAILTAAWTAVRADKQFHGRSV